MKRPLLAAALAGALGLFPVAGHASVAHGLSCTLQGTADFLSPVKTGLNSNEASLSAGIICYDANTDGSAINGDQAGGDFTAALDGATSCAGGTFSGTFSAVFDTESGRDLWSGNAGTAGGFAAAVDLTLRSIEHQTFDSGTQEWVTQSEETISAGLIAGGVVLQADPTLCAGDGFSTAELSGHLGGLFTSGT